MPAFPTRPEQILLYPSNAFADTDWHEALARGDSDEARALFIKRLRTGPSRTCLEHDIPALYRSWMDNHAIGFQGGHWLDPDMVAEQRYIGVYGLEHQFEGEIDWLYDPTADWGADRTAEWQVQLNRHYQWIPLADKYHETGDPKYARAFENELRSWVAQCPRPDNSGMSLPGCWRLIEVGIRAGWSWPYAFETFRKSEHVSDEAIWQMVAALHEHGMHLLLWPTQRNFKAMESNGLTHVGAMFPEFAMSRSFFTTGVDRTCAELERQVYDDGLQDELAPSYGIVSLSNFYSALQMARRFPHPASAVPRRAWDRIALMGEALSSLADPDARLPAIHDSPAHMIDGLHEDFRQHVDAERFAARPWRDTGVTHLPWGGWTVMRRDERYSLFDAGPWGTGHQHADALQLLTYAHGKWLCIDPGKPLYNRSALTRHVRSSAGHNVVLADGRRHQPSPKVPCAESPWPIAVHDEGDVYAVAAGRSAAMADEPGFSFQHERVVMDVAALGWVVLDRLHADDDAAHWWQWLWHTQMDRIDVCAASSRAHAVYEDGPGLLVQPVGAAVTMESVSGRTSPDYLGWRTEGPGNEPTPTPTLSVASSQTAQPVTLITLLVPTPNAHAPALSVTEQVFEHASTRLTVTCDDQPFTFTWQGEDAVAHITAHLPDDRDIAIDVAPHTVSP